MKSLLYLGSIVILLLLLGLFPRSTYSQLRFIGNVDGKLFLADRTTLRTWQDSVIFCVQAGMRIASVETDAHVALWNASYNAVTFHDAYWTAGRDAHNYEQFLWHTNSHKLPNNLVWGAYGGFQTCVMFNAGQRDTGFVGRGCGDKYGVICELLLSAVCDPATAP